MYSRNQNVTNGANTNIGEDRRKNDDNNKRTTGSNIQTKTANDDRADSTTKLTYTSHHKLPHLYTTTHPPHLPRQQQ